MLTAAQQMVLDKYVEAMKEVWKEKVPETRNIKKVQVDVDANTKELKSFYREIIAKIKTFCPDLFDELGYKPWSEDVTTRVQNWINIVLAGNDPTAVAGVPAEAATIGNNTPASNTPAASAPSYSAAAPMVDDEDPDDLPF